MEALQLVMMMEAKSKNNTAELLVVEITQFKTNLTEAKLYQNVHVITGARSAGQFSPCYCPSLLLTKQNSPSDPGAAAHCTLYLVSVPFAFVLRQTL